MCRLMFVGVGFFLSLLVVCVGVSYFVELSLLSMVFVVWVVFHVFRSSAPFWYSFAVTTFTSNECNMCSNYPILTY